MSDKVIHATTESFQRDVLQSSVPVVVDYWAPWCGPCRMISPVLDELAARYEGKVKVVKVNIDNEPDLATTYQVRGIPTLNTMENGKVTGQMVGFGGKGKLVALFEELSKKNAA